MLSRFQSILSGSNIIIEDFSENEGSSKYTVSLKSKDKDELHACLTYLSLKFEILPIRISSFSIKFYILPLTDIELSSEKLTHIHFFKGTSLNFVNFKDLGYFFSNEFHIRHCMFPKELAEKQKFFLVEDKLTRKKDLDFAILENVLKNRKMKSRMETWYKENEHNPEEYSSKADVKISDVDQKFSSTFYEEECQVRIREALLFFASSEFILNYISISKISVDKIFYEFKSTSEFFLPKIKKELEVSYFSYEL